jgi:hypothetical protein
MNTVGVILSVTSYPKNKPFLDTFINPNLDAIANILAIEVNLYFLFHFLNNLFKLNLFRIMLNLPNIDQSYKIESKFLIH